MCGRFTQYYTYAEVYGYMNMIGGGGSNMQPRYHLCPTDPVDTILQAKDGLTMEKMRWGLVPYWWKEPLKKVPATFNARAETVTTKPFFRESWRRRRCIIPASGYYEWQDRADGKQPWYFTPAKAPVFLIAGLWEAWRNPETKEDLRSSTMIITEPNKFVAQYHDRMPVLLAREEVGNWLTGAYGVERLVPSPNDWLKAHPVSRAVNSSKAPDSPDLIKEIAL